MEFTFTDTIYVDIERIIEDYRLSQMSTESEIDDAIADYSAMYDDYEYYAFDNIWKDVKKAIKNELNIYD